MKAGLDSLVELERLGAQTNAVLKSTGGIAGISAKDVRALAEEYESLNATIDDKVIQNTENLLLTFTDVRKEAFEPALAAILDMNAALGGGEEGLQSVTIQVGKALQDPIRGLTALRRVGVNFTKDQEKQIKALVETGDVMGAQKLIIAELNREFGGSFLAQGDTTAGKVAKFQDAIEDLQKALATALLPTVGKVADKLSAFLAKPETIAAVERLGDEIGALFSDENIGKAGQFLGDAFDTVKSVLPQLKDAAVITGQVLSTAVGIFKSLPPDIQKLAIGALAVNKLTGGLLTNIVGLALSSLKTITAANVTVIGANVTGTGGGTGGAPAAAAAGGFLAPGLGAAATVAAAPFAMFYGIPALAEALWGKMPRTAPNAAPTASETRTNPAANLVGYAYGITDPMRSTNTPQAVTVTNTAALGDALDASGATMAARQQGARLEIAVTRSYNAIERLRTAREAPTDKTVNATLTDLRRVQQTKIDATNARLDQQRSVIQRTGDASYNAVERARSAIWQTSASSTASIVTAIRGLRFPPVTVTVSANSVTKAQRDSRRVGSAAGHGALSAE